MKKSDLKIQNPWANINIIDMLALLDPTNTNKFLPLIIKEHKNVTDTQTARYLENNEKEYIVDEICGIYGLENKRSHIQSLSIVELDVLKSVFRGIAQDINIPQTLSRFDNHCKSNRISNKDISTYKSIDEIIEANMVADVQSLDNDKRKSVHIVMENESWLIIKPLTFESSLKYGSSTKWCTSMSRHPNHFYLYSKDGVLLYIINKVNASKSACFINLMHVGGHDNKLRFYDSSDIERDSYVLGLDKEVMDVILNEEKLGVTNKNFIRENYPEIYDNWETQRLQEDYFMPMNAPIVEEVWAAVPTDGIVMGDPATDLVTEWANLDIPNPLEEMTTTTTEIPVDPYYQLINNIKKHIKKTHPIRRFFSRFFSDKLIIVGIPQYSGIDLEYLDHKFNHQSKIKGYVFMFYYGSEDSEITFSSF